MMKRFLSAVICAGGLLIGLQLGGAPDARADPCKEQEDREIPCGSGCPDTDWYDWYDKGPSGYWTVVLTEVRHCEECCSEDECVADTAVDFDGTCWCDGEECS